VFVSTGVSARVHTSADFVLYLSASCAVALHRFWQHHCIGTGTKKGIVLQVQRNWLREQAATITAPITLIASGSVLFGSPSRVNSPSDHPPFSHYCSGDDWDCYRPAQKNLIAELARIHGCVIVLTGDYHAADIKRIVPGEAAGYADVYIPPVRSPAVLLLWEPSVTGWPQTPKHVYALGYCAVLAMLPSTATE
jgi:hypothetical protein